MSYISKENFFWGIQASSYLANISQCLSTVLCRIGHEGKGPQIGCFNRKRNSKNLLKEGMIGAQGGHFRVGPWIANPWDLRQLKTGGSAWAERNHTWKASFLCCCWGSFLIIYRVLCIKHEVLSSCVLVTV